MNERALVPSNEPEPRVLLIAPPWQSLTWPSIQLGILHAVLERAGIGVGVRSLNLAFMDHCLTATAAAPEPGRIDVADYHRVAARHYWLGLGDWIFSVPPFRDGAALDEEYLAYLRRHRVSDADVAKALTMRALVPAFLDRCVTEIVAEGPRVVGFTTALSQTVAALVLAQKVKHADPRVAIVFGGAGCDGPMGAALHRAFPWVDVVVRGEAERVLPDLVRDLFAGGPVRPRPGLCYRQGDRSIAVEQPRTPSVPMDEVPSPVFDEYFERLEKTAFAWLVREVRLPFESSRGCWWGATSHCTFCGLNGTSMAFRSKRPDRVAEELLALARRHGRLDLLAVDNILDLDYLTGLLPRLRDAGADLSIFYETKSNLRRDQVRLLREAGVDQLGTGIESLSTPVLKLMRKGVTALQNIRLLKWCAEYGIHAHWNLIYGFPGEPREEYARMSDVAEALTHLEPPSIGRLSLDRFSPYHERAAEFGLEVVGPLPFYRLVYPADDSTLGDLAYSFEYRYADGRDPEDYAGPLRDVVESWRAAQDAGFRSLRYRRGPGFLVIDDARPNLTARQHTLREREARVYLACEDGATPAEVRRAVADSGLPELSVEDIQAFLDQLVAERLAYVENGRYLALALPARLPEMR